MAIPLYELTSKKTEFIWKDIHQEAFTKIQNSMINLPSLAAPQDNGELLLKCDASGVALGCVLSQYISGKEYPIAFASRKLNRAETKYSTIDREILAIVWATKKLRHYLIDRLFSMEKYHNPLKYLSRFKDAHNRRSRWLMHLKEFNFEID